MSTQGVIPGYLEGQYAEVPGESYQQALQQGFKPGVTLTSPEGRKAVVPPELADKATKEQGFAMGPPDQQPKTKMFGPKGEYAEVPNNAVKHGLNNGWHQAVETTSPLGHSVPLPKDLADAAQKSGWQLGTPDQQKKPGFLASALGSMMGANREDTANSKYESSTLGQRARALADIEPVPHLPGQTLPIGPQHKTQAAKDLGVNPEHLTKLQELEAKAEKGVPWEDQLADKFPIIGSQIRAGVKAVKPTKPGEPTRGISERLGHAGAAALPFVGPMAEGAGEAAGQGDWKSAAGQAAFAALPFLMHAAPKTPRSEPIRPASAGLMERTKSAGVRLLAGDSAEAKPSEPAAGPGTHAEVADYAANKGIELTPAQATQSKPLKAIQAVGERAVVGGKPLQDVLTRQHGQVAAATEELHNRVGNPYTPDAESVGEHLQSQAHEKLQALKDKATADYNDFKEKTGGQGFDVDLSPVVDKYKGELQKQGEVLKNVPEQFAAPIRNMLEKISGIKSDLPRPEASPVVRMDTAQQLRSYYLEIARDRSGNIPSRVNRLAASAAADIDAAMEKSAGEHADTWRQANQTYRQLQETYNDKASPLTKLISEPDPQKITGSLLAKGRFGGNSRTVRLLNQNGYNLSPLRHQVMSDIVGQNFKLTNGGNGLGGYQLPFLKELFEPHDLNEIMHLGRVARAVKFELNPSGTSNVMEALSQLRSVAGAKSPSLLGAGAGFALGGPIGAAVGAAGTEGLVPAAAARFSANPRNLSRALNRPAFLEGRNLERGSTTPENLDEALAREFQKTSTRDTNFSTQARDELFPGRNPEQLTPPELSQVMQKAQELKAMEASLTQVEKPQPVRGLGHYSPEDQAQVKALPDFLRQVEPRQLSPAEEKTAYGQARVSQLRQQLREAMDPEERVSLQRQLEHVQGQRGSATGDEMTDLAAKNPVWNSRLEQVAQEKLPAKFTGDQAMSTLKNAGVKADELATVEPVLKGQQMISKSTLISELKKSNLASQVQDVWKAGALDIDDDNHPLYQHPLTRELYDAGYQVEPEAFGRGTLGFEGPDGISVSVEDIPGELGDKADKLEDAYHEMIGQKGTIDFAPKYAEHQLPGGENYRELLLQLPEKLPENAKNLTAKKDAFTGRWTVYDKDGSIAKGDQRNMYAPNANTAIQDYLKSNSQMAGPFSSSHWDEPNVLGHLRMNDRVDVHGKKTLFLEELQSDWHQQGRRNGYREPTGSTSGIGQNPGAIVDTEDRNAVPDAPFKKDWHELLLKRALREAAESGADQLAWTPGDVQNERYDLSKHVESVGYTKNKDGSYNIQVVQKGGHNETNMGTYKPEKLADAVGKELAQKIIDDKGSYNEPAHPETAWFDNQDLKIGGAGMRGFYDKLVPDFLNRYAKKWGVKVGSTEIQLGNTAEIPPSEQELESFAQREYNSTFRALSQGAQADVYNVIIDDHSKRKNQPVQKIDITPKMRQDILRGQPISDLQPGTKPGLPMLNRPSTSEGRLPWA